MSEWWEFPCVLFLVAMGLLVLVAMLGGFDPPDRPGPRAETEE